MIPERIDPKTDEQLVHAVREGDRDAFTELVRRYEGRVASTVIGMLGPGPDADDVGQETFVRLYRGIGSFRGESSLGTYITRIAINLSLNELKRRKRRFSLFRDPGDKALSDSIDEKTSGTPFEDKEVVHRALEKLEPGFRAVIVLRLLDGYSTRETARILNVPVGTVLSRLARAQMKMRELLTPYFGEEHG